MIVSFQHWTRRGLMHRTVAKIFHDSVQFYDTAVATVNAFCAYRSASHLRQSHFCTVSVLCPVRSAKMGGFY